MLSQKSMKIEMLGLPYCSSLLRNNVRDLNSSRLFEQSETISQVTLGCPASEEQKTTEAKRPGIIESGHSENH